MPGTQSNTPRQGGRVNGHWVSSVTAAGFTIGGLVGASLKIEDLTRVGCKVGPIPLGKFVLSCTTLGWLAYVIFSTGLFYRVFKYCPRMSRNVFIAMTILLAVLWLGMTMWTSVECSDTCSQCPKLAQDSDIGTRFLWGIAGSVCTCTTNNGQNPSSSTGATTGPLNNTSVLKWRSVASLDTVSQLYNIFHQYGIVVVLTICLISSAYLSRTEWNTTTQDPNNPVPQPDIPFDDLENGRAVSVDTIHEEREGPH